MRTFKYTITDENGIHARPAGLLAKCASRFKSETEIAARGKTADAKRIFAIMGLGAKKGDELTATVRGDDEDAAASEIKEFLEQNM